MNKMSILLSAVVIMMFVSIATSAPQKSGAKSGPISRNPTAVAAAMSQNEFHLTCTVLLDGSPSPPPPEETPEDARRRAAGKKKASKKSKRSVGSKVQLLCDIDNPEGQEIARRSAIKKKTKSFSGDYEDDRYD